MEDSLPLLTVRDSRRRRAVWLVMHMAAFAAVWYADLFWWAGLALTGAIGLGLYTGLRERPPVMLRCRPDGVLAFEADGEARMAAILPDSLVWAWLVVIRYRLDGHRRPGALVVLPDSLAAEDFRRLRVWLRWRAVVAGGDGGRSHDKDADVFS